MASAASFIRDFIYLDSKRVRSLAMQMGLQEASGDGQPVEDERLFIALEEASAGGASVIDERFDYTRWTQENFRDGQFFRAKGLFRILDFNWLSLALGGLPAVLRKMSKIEMEALKNSEEGKKMSKSQLQQRSQENQAAIGKIEEFKMDELNDVVRRLYGEIVRVKVRPSKEYPGAVLVGAAYTEHFYDAPVALSQKHGIEIDAGWVVVGQINMPNPAPAAAPIPVGNQMEDSFEQIALLMNNAFKVANSPAFPAVSFTPLAIYREIPRSDAA